MDYPSLLNRLLPESTISATLTSTDQFPKEQQIFTNKRNLEILNKRTFIYSNANSSIQFHFNFFPKKGKLLKREIGESTEWLDEPLKRVKFVLWKESFNFRRKNFGIETDDKDKESQIREETDEGTHKQINARIRRITGRLAIRVHVGSGLPIVPFRAGGSSKKAEKTVRGEACAFVRRCAKKVDVPVLL